MTIQAEEIIRLLEEAQNSQYNHPKLLKSLNSLLHEHLEEGETLETFFDVFFTPFSNVLLVVKRSLAVERVLDFSVKFAVSTAPRDAEKGVTACMCTHSDLEYTQIHTYTHTHS